MEDLPVDLKAFLLNHQFLQLADSNKIKCTLNGHEFPCNLTELQNFTKGKKYQKLSATADFNYSQYEPHVVPSSKQPNHLFCKLTLRHLNRLPHHVLRHVNGKRFKKAQGKYEECMRQGIEFVPASLKQKKHKGSGREGRRGPDPQRGNATAWDPTSSDEDHSDSEDSMSDLYPPSMFSLKKEAEGDEEDGEEVKKPEDDDFKTDDEEDEEMEVEKQAPQKRKKVQGGGFQKKFKNNRWKKQGFKTSGKVKNGK